MPSAKSSGQRILGLPPNIWTMGKKNPFIKKKKDDEGDKGDDSDDKDEIEEKKKKKGKK